MPDTVDLSVDGRVVAEYAWQPALPAGVSPRPYLHPVRTLGGTEVTELMPDDHQHHLGVSVAVADVGGANFWGGRTFVAGRGPVALDNHGSQRHCGFGDRTPSALSQHLRWTDAEDVDLLHERRRIAARALSADAWALDFEFELTNLTAVPLSFASPATNGRPGAGYGGFFWRARRGAQRIQVLGPERNGERYLHGSRGPWLALTGVDAGPWTLVFVTGCGADPWFVRSRDYAGVGSSLAWDKPLVVGSGATIRRRIITVVADGRLRSRQVAGAAGLAAAILAEAGSPP